MLIILQVYFADWLLACLITFYLHDKIEWSLISRPVYTFELTWLFRYGSGNRSKGAKFWFRTPVALGSTYVKVSLAITSDKEVVFCNFYLCLIPYSKKLQVFAKFWNKNPQQPIRFGDDWMKIFNRKPKSHKIKLQ